jgi:hypothetical protein
MTGRAIAKKIKFMDDPHNSQKQLISGVGIE